MAVHDDRTPLLFGDPCTPEIVRASHLPAIHRPSNKGVERDLVRSGVLKCLLSRDRRGRRFPGPLQRSAPSAVVQFQAFTSLKVLKVALRRISGPP